MAQDPVALTDSGQDAITQRTWRFVLLAVGVISFSIIYGILQEKIMRHSYDGERFRDSMFLVSINRAVTILFTFCMLVFKRESFRSEIPVWKYAIVSIANVYSSVCQYEALKYVSFTVATLGKTFKMIPVMIWGIAISKKEYKRIDWFLAILVTLGCVEFMLTGEIKKWPKAADHHYPQDSTLPGYLLILSFLALDGLTSTMQEKLFRDYTDVKYRQMLYINCISMALTIIHQVVQNSLVSPLLFFAAHKDFARDSLCLGVSAMGQQFFAFSQVQEFGAIFFAAAMNLRQVLSIVLSHMVYHHLMSVWQLFGLLIAFGALFYKAYLGILDQETPKEEEKTILEKHRLRIDEVRITPDVEAVTSYESTSLANR